MPKEDEHSNASTKPTTKPQKPRLARVNWQVPSRYEVRQTVGTGSYGQVCRARMNGSGGYVAIKRIGNLFDDKIDCKRVLREVKILSQLNHSCVVRLHDLCTTQNLDIFSEIYVVLELCDSDLKKLFKQNIYLQEMHVKTLLYNLLCGVQYIHSAGIYHRDLKPANCLVNHDCSVKICDFGLSRAVGAREEEEENDDPSKIKRTLTSHVVTRWYRAPELILLNENYNALIDVWSCGCIFAELLNMQEDHCKDTKARQPLFPGSTCYPLSPHHDHREDFRYHTKEVREQLNVIFDRLGTPESVDFLNSMEAKLYLAEFRSRKGSGLESCFPKASRETLLLLYAMLEISPERRMPINRILQFGYFDSLRRPELEKGAPRVIQLDLDSIEDLTVDILREEFTKEMDQYR